MDRCEPSRSRWRRSWANVVEEAGTGDVALAGVFSAGLLSIFTGGSAWMSLLLVTGLPGAVILKRRFGAGHGRHHVEIWCDTSGAATEATLHCESRHDHGDVFDLLECTVVDPLGFDHVLLDEAMTMYDWSADPHFRYPKNFTFQSTSLLRGGVHRVRWRARFRDDESWMQLGETAFTIHEGLLRRMSTDE